MWPLHILLHWLTINFKFRTVLLLLSFFLTFFSFFPSSWIILPFIRSLHLSIKLTIHFSLAFVIFLPPALYALKHTTDLFYQLTSDWPCKVGTSSASYYHIISRASFLQALVISCRKSFECHYCHDGNCLYGKTENLCTRWQEFTMIILNGLHLFEVN